MTTTDLRLIDGAGDLDQGLLAQLREMTTAVDNLWRSALSEGTGQSAVQLGEASQGLHRALIALSSMLRPQTD